MRREINRVMIAGKIGAVLRKKNDPHHIAFAPPVKSATAHTCPREAASVLKDFLLNF
jgi:hypothetical protein